MNKKIVVLFSGNGGNIVNLAHTLKHVDIHAICNRPDAAGIQKAKAVGIKVDVIDHKAYDSREAFDARLVMHIEAIEPDLVVCAGYMRILTPVFTDNITAINLHPTLLPKYKGSNALQRGFEADDYEAGATVHYVTSELDGGDIIAQASFKRDPLMDFDGYLEAIKATEYQLLPTAIKLLLMLEPNAKLILKQQNSTI